MYTMTCGETVVTYRTREGLVRGMIRASRKMGTVARGYTNGHLDILIHPSSGGKYANRIPPEIEDADEKLSPVIVLF